MDLVDQLATALQSLLDTGRQYPAWAERDARTALEAVAASRQVLEAPPAGSPLVDCRRCGMSSDACLAMPLMMCCETCDHYYRQVAANRGDPPRVAP